MCVAGLADAQAQHAEQRDKRVGGVAVPAGGAEHGGELQRVQHGAMLPFPRHARPGHRQARVGRDKLVNHGVLEQARDCRQAAADRGRGAAALLQLPQVQLEVRPPDGQRLNLVIGAPLPEAPQVTAVGTQGGLSVAGQEAGHSDVRRFHAGDGQGSGHDGPFQRRRTMIVLSPPNAINCYREDNDPGRRPP